MSADVSADLTDFAAVTHELRAPLHAILGLAELLVSSGLDPEAHDLALSIQRQGEAMQVVIDDVLDLSRIKAGALELVSGAFAPRSLIDEVHTTFEPAATAKGLVLSTSIADSVPRSVRSDRHRLRQILVNLVSNAVKYTESGSVDVRLDLVRPDRLRLFVTDSGPGIPPDKVDDLFDAYTQARGEDRVKGTGLGLSIVKRLVELFDGELYICSSEAGTTFALTIPFAAARRAGDAAPEPRAPAITGRTVLVIDDSDVNRVVAEAQLDRLGHQCLVAESGPEGLELLLAVPIDLVLLDWHMPGMDGLEVLRRYRERIAESGGELTPIVMMTAHVSEQARRECAEAGADDFLPKPVAVADLAACLDRWFVPVHDQPAVDDQHPAAAPDPGPAVVDRSVIDQMVGDLGGADAVCMVIDTFVGDLANRRGDLFAEEADVSTRAAHTLKSTSSLLGVPQLSKRLGEVESRLREGGSLGPSEHDDLNAALDATVEALREVAEELAAANHS